MGILIYDPPRGSQVPTVYCWHNLIVTGLGTGYLIKFASVSIFMLMAMKPNDAEYFSLFYKTCGNRDGNAL
jgi:hypothetical protein